MPALVKSQYTATITWLGRVPEDAQGIAAEPVPSVTTTLAGVQGEVHSGESRAACSRFGMLYPKGTTVRNTRQLSVLSVEELEIIAQKMGLRSLNPAHLGASMVVEGIPDLSHLTPGTRLLSPHKTVVTIDLENAPCHFPGQEIEAEHPGYGKAFKAAADGLRGVTAWIERAGPLSVGDTLSVMIPTQPAWAPEAQLRAAE